MQRNIIYPLRFFLQSGYYIAPGGRRPRGRGGPMRQPKENGRVASPVRRKWAWLGPRQGRVRLSAARVSFHFFMYAHKYYLFIIF
jgi:hypothetical protein